MQTYTDTLFCDHCQKDTEHIVQDDEHERDSSNDVETCTVCRWYRSGYDGKYHAPLFEYTASSKFIDHFMKEAPDNAWSLMSSMPQVTMIDPIQNMPEEQLIDLIKFIGCLHQDGHRSYKSMAEEVRKYISESISGQNKN